MDYCYSCMNELKQGDFCTSCMKQNTPDGYVHHLKPGTVLGGKYLVGNCLGEGGFGITYIGRDLTLDIKVAIKEYYPNGYVNRNNEATQMVTATAGTQAEFFGKGKERFLQEARNIARFMGEPGIVGVKEYFECNNTAYIIMEYLDGENLSTYIKRNGVFDPETIFRLILPITRSLQRMHEEGIIHRDIAPDNIMLLKNGTLKLTDFGSARFFTNEEKEMSVMLKQGYAPEEQYRKNGHQGPWTDVYGLCATLYKCITGVSPEDALDRLREDGLKKPSELGIAIPVPLEIVLMYGLAVFKENRCQSMAELGELIQKALNRQNIAVNSTPNVRDEIYRTQAADDYYKTQVAEGFESAAPAAGYGYAPQPRPAAQPHPMPHPTPQPAPIYTPPEPQKEKGPNNKTVILIVAICAVVALAAIGAMLFALLGGSGDDEKGEKKNSESSSQVGEDQDTADDTDSAVGETVAVMNMPGCVNRKYSSAKEELEGMGLAVSEKYEFSDSVTKDYVISQSIAEGMQVEAGDEVELTVSKGSDVCPYDYQQKLTVTASAGKTKGKATLYEWKDGDWKKQATYTCTVGSNGIGSAQEGAKATPKGLHHLGVVLSAYYTDTNMRTYKATSNTCVVDDTYSELYNMIMDKDTVPNGVSYDRIGEGLTNGTTYATIYIEHNGTGFSSEGVVRGKGSAIGVRGQYGSLKATWGDVDISADDMTDLLSRLDFYKNPMIEIKVK